LHQAPLEQIISVEPSCGASTLKPDGVMSGILKRVETFAVMLPTSSLCLQLLSTFDHIFPSSSQEAGGLASLSRQLESSAPAQSSFLRTGNGSLVPCRPSPTSTATSFGGSLEQAPAAYASLVDPMVTRDRPRRAPGGVRVLLRFPSNPSTR
jgi:hypothetical protein